jgi:hypothetical protein
MVVDERYWRPRVGDFLHRGLSERKPARGEGACNCKSSLHHRQRRPCGRRNRAYHKGSRLSIRPEAARQAVLLGQGLLSARRVDVVALYRH